MEVESEDCQCFLLSHSFGGQSQRNAVQVTRAVCRQPPIMRSPSQLFQLTFPWSYCTPAFVMLKAKLFPISKERTFESMKTAGHKRSNCFTTGTCRSRSGLQWITVEACS